MNYYDYLSDLTIIDEAYKKLDEALPLSIAKSYSRGWDKTRLNDWFQGKNRLTIPMSTGGTAAQSPVEKEIAAALAPTNYSISDYKTGTATGGDGRTMRIGKLLNRMGKSELIKKFNEDETRSMAKSSKNSEFSVVISRHPYDIAGQSTDRNWTSCMNLANGGDYGRPGVHAKCVEPSTKLSLVAYLVKKDDGNIKRPVMRALILPYSARGGDGVIYRASRNVYGDENPDIRSAFLKTVDEWLDERNGDDSKKSPRIYDLDPRLYKDTETRSSVVDGVSELRKNPKLINSFIERYDLLHAGGRGTQLLIHMIGEVPEAYQHISPPNDKVARSVVKYYPFHIQYMKHPDEQTQLNAIDHGGWDVLRFIDHPTENVQRMAVENSPILVKFIADPTEEIQKFVVGEHPAIIKRILNPTEDVQVMAVSKDGHLLADIIENAIKQKTRDDFSDFPSKRVIDAAKNAETNKVDDKMLALYFKYMRRELEGIEK
jgi:hypothetical protein